MSNQSGYSRNSSHPRSYYQNGSLNSSDSSHLYAVAREMGPPYPPQPIEIDLNNSRTLPSPSASASNAWDPTMFPSHGIGEGSPFVSSSLQRNLQMENQGRVANQDPLVNWYTGNDGPWIPKGISEVVADERSPKARVSSRIPVQFGENYRQPNPSDAGSYHFGAPPSDSGYASNGAKRSDGNASIFSADIADRDQDLQSLAGHIADYQPYQGMGDMLQPREVRPNGHWTNPLPSSSVSDSQPKLRCPTCHKTVKTPSELKKHALRHTRPFKCDYEGCLRTDGFSTTNDLERHIKSKHPLAAQGIGSTKRYRCLVPGCKSSGKLWPRLDNFRSHLKRVHHMEADEEDDMIRRSSSEFWDSASIADQGRISPTHSYPLPDTSQPIELESQETLSTVRNNEPTWKQVFPETAKLFQEPFDLTRSSLGGHEEDAIPEQKVTSSDVVLRETMPPLDIFSDPPQVHEYPASLGNSLIAPVSPDESAVKESAIPQPTTQIPKVNPQGKATRRDVSASASVTAKLTEIMKTALVGARILGEDDDCSLHHSGKNALHKPHSPPGRLCSPGSKSQNPTSVSEEHIRSTDSPASQDRDTESQKKAAEVLKTLHDLGYVIHKDPTHSPKPLNAGSVASRKSEHLVTCVTCGKFKGRPCELMKHMKRHSRPYGCTFAKCTKTFGSKNDWKRHENSQHFHLETWRCHEARPEGGACAKVCYRRQTFQDHLKKDHSISDEDAVKSKLDLCRIGRNCQARFWCGFCTSLVDLTKKGVDAWTERFNHIDNHFMGRAGLSKQSIQNWIEIDGNKPKGDGPSIGPMESSRGKDTDEESSSPSGSTSDGSGSAGGSPAHAEIPTTDVTAPKRKHSGSCDDQRTTKRPKAVYKGPTQVYCCQCGGAHNIKIDVNCSTCADSHQFCGNCTREHQS